MPWLVQHRLYEPKLPSNRVTLLRALDHFIDDATELRRRRTAGLSVDTSDLREDHDNLQRLSQTLGTPGFMVDQQTAERAFASGVLRAVHYRETVLSGLPLVDLAGSATLAEFDIDIEPEAAGVMEAALRTAFDFDDDAMAALHAEIEPELDALRARQRLIEALEAEVPVATGDPDAVSHALFTRLFPDHPLRVGEVRVIRTGTSLFLCVPFEGDALTDPTGARTSAEEAEVTAFLQHLSQFRQRYLAHFPVFGCFHASDADPALIEALARSTGLDADRVIRKLTTMVTVLATAEIDKYIVHDAWGHQWQALLFDFEDRYQEAATYRRLPALDATYDGHSLLDAARSFADGHGIDAFDRYLQAALSHRLAISLSGLFAEVLADVVEYKYLWLHPDKRALMPSSSFFKELPTKLDLTLWDIPNYFDWAEKGFERFSRRPKLQRRLRDALAAEGITDPAVTEAFAARTAAWLDEVYRGHLEYDIAEDGVFVNVFARVVLQFAKFQAQFNEVYERLSKQTLPASVPMDRFQDVLVFTTASFYEQDPSQHLWLTDDFVADWFETLFTRFVNALQDITETPT